MCKDCGCEEGNARAYFEGNHGHSHDHSHDHDHSHEHVHVKQGGRDIHIHIHVSSDEGHHHHHDHAHDHDHDHSHEATPSADEQRSRTIALETKVLAHNDKLAAKNRSWLADRSIVAVNLISSPGSGKTFLLEKTLEALNGKLKCAVIVGDQQTDNDAKRLDGKGAKVHQIETKSSCHLNAQQVGEHLAKVVDDDVKILFIENVGNLVCPAAFDLGEQKKIAILSVTEGEDKPIKYPVLFNDAPITIVTKTDLLPHLEVDIQKCRDSIKTVRPDATIFELSAKTGDGMDAWLGYLKGLVG